MSDIKVVEKITEDEFRNLYMGEKIDLGVEDFGFCLKGELTDEEEKELSEIEKKIEDLCGKMHTLRRDGENVIINDISVPKELSKRQEELEDKIYSKFEYAAPGYMDETMKIAKENDRDIHIPKGSRMYYDYPLSCVVVVEIQRDLEKSSEFIKAFCEGYQEIYALEKDSSKIKEGNIPGMLNRVTTNGCFGIWGHGIGDLVLEEVYVYKDGDIYRIEFSIGS